MTIAHNLKLYRKAAGLSQIELALKAGVSEGCVQYAENPAHEPTIGSLRKLADALDIPLPVLIGVEVSGEAMRIGLMADRLEPADQSFVVGMIERFAERVAA